MAEKMPRATVMKAIDPSTAIGKEDSDEEMTQDLEAMVDEGTGGMGVMLYYGELGQTDGNNAAKFDLLNHCIACLQTVHHKGSAIIKLANSFDLFNASIAFLLY